MVRKGRGYSRSEVPKVSVGLRLLSQGTYQRNLIGTTAGSWTAVTEVSVSAFASSLVASGADKVFPWIRMKMWVSSAATGTMIEWVVVKQKSADAIPNFDDSAAMEALKKDGKIFGHSLLYQAPRNLESPKAISGEWRNVYLVDGEVLRLVYKPVLGSAADVTTDGLIEYTEMVS